VVGFEDVAHLAVLLDHGTGPFRPGRITANPALQAGSIGLIQMIDGNFYFLKYISIRLKLLKRIKDLIQLI